MAVYKRGDRWYTDYYVNGRRIRRAVGHKFAAVKVVTRNKAEVYQNFGITSKNLNALVDRYSEHVKTSLRSWVNPYHQSQEFLEYMKKVGVTEPTPLHIEQYREYLYRRIRQASINRHMACLRHMFNLGIRWGLWDKNPVQGFKFYNEKRFRRTRYLTNEEIGKLLSSLKSDARFAVLLTINTGVRRGELLNLTWSDVDLQARHIVLKETKSGEPRFVPLNSTVCDLLQSQKVKSGKVVKLGKSGLRFQFEKAAKQAGLENFRFHDLRHTFASHLVMSGTDLMTVKELLGHKTLDMTMRYSHLSQTHKQKAVENLSIVTKWSQ